MIHSLLFKLDKMAHFDEAKAHCDIPCGIYDPISAQIAAVTVARMIDLMADLAGKTSDKTAPDYMMAMARYSLVKEEHAEKAKAEIRVIWGDYFKAAHLEK